MVLKAKKTFGAKHFDAIEKNVPQLEQLLDDARKAYEAAFWAKSGLSHVKKAQEDSGQVHALTAEEATIIKEAVQKLDVSGAYADALYNEMAILVEVGWESAKHLLDLSTQFGTVPTAALNALRKEAEQFAFMLVQRENQALIDTVDVALAEGWTPARLAEQIQGVFAEGYHVYDGENLVRTVPTDTWSEMVARTELSRAQTLGNLDLYKAAQIEKVLFATTQGSNVCPECEDLDGEIIAIADLSDDDTPPLHPNCCCALIAADDDIASEDAA